MLTKQRRYPPQLCNMFGSRHSYPSIAMNFTRGTQDILLMRTILSALGPLGKTRVVVTQEGD